MAYLDKGIENEKMAKISYENKCYNSCVNRYYYSFFQVLLNAMKKYKLEIGDEQNGEGSHVKTFKCYKKYIQNVKKIKITRVNQMNGNFIKLKNLRKKADYEELMIEKDEADSAISAYNSLRREIESI